MPSILLIKGSAGTNTTADRLIAYIADQLQPAMEVRFAPSLHLLPHFDPELTLNLVPEPVQSIRQQIEQSSAVIIVTPEYIHSIPSGLKNLFEWCVAVTVWQDKPTALITASADGQQGEAETVMILHTIMARILPEHTLRIPGARGRIEASGKPDDALQLQLSKLLKEFTGSIQP